MTIKITPYPNGPIGISTDDAIDIQMPGGEQKTLEGNSALCRCGASQNKPFCDGAHGGISFDSTNNCTTNELRTSEAPDITVHFNRSICCGAAACVHSLPAVFKSEGDDWIQPAEASAEEVIATVNKCPSGALSYTVSGTTHIKEDQNNSITVIKNGPYLITGLVDFAPEEWSANASKTVFALCRCGKSANHPFCDYSHGEQKWDDSAT